ncbi:MAG: TolC family protein [Bryobacteraceae bacterium]|nr:TolC family protein [Bryobacteraceae bacterium]
MLLSLRYPLAILTLCSLVFGQDSARKLKAPEDTANPFTEKLRTYDEVAAPRFYQNAYVKQSVFIRADPTFSLADPTRLKDFVVGDKLELSLRSYLELVLANNTQIQLQKVLIQPQRNAIQRAFGVFDPIATARFTATRQETPTTDALAGAAVLSQLSQPFNLGVTQLLESGLQYQVNYNASKLSTNNSFANFNPNYNSALNVTLTQPLLRNRGGYFNKIPVYVARANLRSAEFRLEDTINRLLANSENAYWDVIGARENLKVQEQALGLADTSLKRAQRELELGAISALDIYQPQATYARAEILVTQARYRLAQFEDVLRLQIGVDLDPDLRKLPLVLTEPVLPPTDTNPFDKEALVTEALSLRPDLKAIRQDVLGDDLTIRQAANNLRPDLSLFGNYTSQGRGGNLIQRRNIFNADGSTSPVLQVTPGGFPDALSQMFGFSYPVYGFGLQLRLPLRDRRAAADFADQVVAKRADLLTQRQIAQQVRLDVLNAINLVENSRASVELAKIAADLAQKRVEAEQKKYDLGTTTLFFVLAAQQDLSQAQSDLVTQSVTYRRNQLNLLQRSGKLLSDRGVVLQ